MPKFDRSDEMHLKLADIGKSCHKKVKIMKFARKNNVRAEVRKKLKSEIMEINQTVSKVLNIGMGGE